ncbi:hypothetical protein ACIO13_22980 [Streptomyces sp. NPDC087425]|uniref:hypothetical protein n=1 Tax=Streptomyces sp. NPDC087425 TaxID=3365787 RepID=UPI003824D08B
MSSLRSVLNRAVLGLAGLACLVGAFWVTAPRTSLAARLPGWWWEPGPHAVFLDRAGLAGLRTEGWWTPTVMAASLAATVLLALWSARQLHGGFRPFVPLAAPGSTLRTRALEDALTRQAVTIDGVARCRTRVLGRRKHLRVRMRVWLRPDVTPGAVLPALTALDAQTGRAVTPYDVRTQVRFSTVPHRRTHVR